MSACTIYLSLFFLTCLSNLVFVAVSQEEETEPNEVDDLTFLKKFNELAPKVACEAKQISDASSLTLNLDRMMSYEEVTKLAFLNKAKPLSEQPLRFGEDIQWKRDLVNVMYDIFMTACPSIYVSHDYIKILRELIMIYLNSVGPRAPGNTDVWQAIQRSLEDCHAKKSQSYKFTSSGLQIQTLLADQEEPRSSGPADVVVEGEVEKGSNEANDETVNEVGGDPSPTDEGVAEVEGSILIPQVEQADQVFSDMDTVIDTFWQVFSHAWATCLPTAPSKELWGPRFKELFFREFLKPLENRWTTLGSRTNSFISVIVGDIDDELMDRNVPFCLQAAYEKNKLTLHQLVRPVRLAGVDESVAAFQNYKLNPANAK